MALVRKSTNGNGAALPAATIFTASASPDGKPLAVSTRDVEAQRKKARTLAKQQQAAERIAAAAVELSSGISEAASASEELRRSAEQIAAGAEEASGAAQESLTAFKQIEASIDRQLQNADRSQARAEATQALVVRTSGDVAELITKIATAAQRQRTSVDMVAQLEKQAANIGDIVKAVARIADQTNLLALNAAIEAARAGKHGKGFAVVADEVRTLAETSEKSAKHIQDLVGQIQQEVKAIAEGIGSSANAIEAEVTLGQAVAIQLDVIRTDAAGIANGVRDTAISAQQSKVAAAQALKGSEDIAAAAEQQSAAAEESTKTVQEQAKALAECETTAHGLSELAEDLKTSTDVAKSAEEVASSAEELSAAVSTIHRSGAQIMAAIEQIRTGAEVQSAGTSEASAAISQIETGLELAQSRATDGAAKVTAMRSLLAINKTSVDSLIRGTSTSAEASRTSIKQIKNLALVSRRIDKIVDAITTVSIQTNMLAVNGAIEAARAGEFGKGFVVVATDIRNLAHDSAENADRIKDLVKAVQDQIGVVGHDLEEIVATALAEVEKAKTTTANLVSIEADIAAIDQGMHEIVGASNEIVTATSQVKKGVEQIAAAAAQAEKASAEAAAAARQQATGAAELAAAIEEISSLADELQSA